MKAEKESVARVEKWQDLTYIEHYLNHNIIFESPTSFWKWSAIGSIAAVLRDSVYKRMGNSRLYPNVYILSLAQSGFHRKNRPIEFAESLVREVKNVKVISGRGSIQAITEELSRTETTKAGQLIKGGSAIFFAPELSAAIVSDLQAVNILTDIYENKPQYKSLLKNSPNFAIENMTFSMIAASNEPLLKRVYDITALQGGLLARTILVLPDEFRKPNSLMKLTARDHQDLDDSKAALIQKLKKIAELKGEVEISEEAQQAYDAWYDPFRRSNEQANDNSGVLGRIHTTALKVAIILAANDVVMRVEPWHIKSAIEFCIGLLPNYGRLAMSAGSTSPKETGVLILSDLFDSPTGSLTKKELFQRHILDFDVIVFDNTILTLEMSEYIKVHFDTSGDPYYILTDLARRKLKLRGI